MKTWLSHLVFFFLLTSGWAQDNGLNPIPLSESEKLFWKSDSIIHTGIRPFIPGFDRGYDKIHKNLLDSTELAFYAGNGEKKNLRFSPVLELGGGYQITEESDILFSAIGGFQMKWKRGDNWYANLSAAGVQMQNPEYLQQFQNTDHIVPGIGYTNSGPLGSSGMYMSGKVGFNTEKYFSFELGNDKNFWGEGYRSLVLSHNAAPYPYFKITTDVWKVKYINIWAQLRDISGGETWAAAQKKYTSLHALSWNFHKKWNLTLYEMVIWQSQDTLSDRGLDLNYLNPVIFYRPIEFSLGSADNEIVGLNLSFRPNDHSQVYTQILLDEFLFKELTSGSGWWANKFGVQLGIKSYNVLKSGFDFQSEINYVRPFTYTHGSVLQNWGHLNQSMAHPLGTNFIEWNNHIKKEVGIYVLRNEFIWAIYGRDRDGDNYGGDLFRSYKNPLRDYDNYIAQGLKSTLQYNEFSVSRPVVKGNNSLKISLSYIWRYESNEFFKTSDHMVLFGISMNPIPRYRDF